MRLLTRAALLLVPVSTLAAATGGRTSAPREITLLVAATTDVHGHLVGWDYYANRPDTARGLARAATIVDSLRAAAPRRAVLVDAGDMLQGTPLTYDAAVAALPLEAERRTAHSDLASTAVFDVGATIDSGAVTVGEIARLYPYENTLTAVRISSAQLKAYLEHSARYDGTFGTSEPAVHADVPGYDFDIVAGANYTIDLTRPIGSRITSLTVRGKPVSDGDSFTLALNNYRRSGGGGYAMLRDAPVVFNSATEIRDLLIAEVERRKHIAPSDYFQRNWSIVPVAAISPAYTATHHWTQ